MFPVFWISCLTYMDEIPSSLRIFNNQEHWEHGNEVETARVGLAPTWNRRGTLGTTQQSTSTRIDSGRKPVLAKQRWGCHPNCAPAMMKVCCHGNSGQQPTRPDDLFGAS